MAMRVRLAFVGLVAALTTFVGLTTVAVAGPDGSDSAVACVLNTQLSPDNEIRTTPNTSVASGHAQITVLNDGTIEFKVFVLNPAGENFFIGHIHGPATSTQNAGIVVDLLGGPAGGSAFTDMTTTLMGDGVPRAAAVGIAELLCASPENYYVNFHTTTEPSGAIRGQLG
jgi:hypothetical protein